MRVGRQRRGAGGRRRRTRARGVRVDLGISRGVHVRVLVEVADATQGMRCDLAVVVIARHGPVAVVGIADGDGLVVEIGGDRVVGDGGDDAGGEVEGVGRELIVAVEGVAVVVVAVVLLRRDGVARVVRADAVGRALGVLVGLVDGLAVLGALVRLLAREEGRAAAQLAASVLGRHRGRGGAGGRERGCRSRGEERARGDGRARRWRQRSLWGGRVGARRASEDGAGDDRSGGGKRRRRRLWARRASGGCGGCE